MISDIYIRNLSKLFSITELTTLSNRNVDKAREKGEKKDFLRIETFNGDLWEMIGEDYGFDVEEKLAELYKYLK